MNLKPLDARDFTSRITLIRRKHMPHSAVAKEFFHFFTENTPIPQTPFNERQPALFC